MMKHILFALIAIVGVIAGCAAEGSSAPLMMVAADTSATPSIDQLTAMGSRSQYDAEYLESMRAAWKRNTYINLIYHLSHKMSSDEFPSTSAPFSAEYDSKWGFGVQWGHTFNFHSRPIASGLFFGLDFTWLDFEFNKFDKENTPAGYSHGEQVHNMPWHNEKTTIGYGLSLGPSMSVFPFASVSNSAINNVRLHLYFHVGYGIEGALIKDAVIKDGATKNGYGYGHGLYTSFGANLSWKCIGFGYEFRNDGKIRYKVTEQDYDTGKLHMKEKTGRLYLQFRF